MEEALQAVYYALKVGSIYALVAFGYSLIFSTTRIVNFAQGTLVVVGGYLGWWMYAEVFDGDVPIAIVTLLVIAASAVVGLLFDLVAIEPLGEFDPATNIGWLVTTLGTAIVAQELVSKLISDTGQSLPALADSAFGWEGSVVADVAIEPGVVVVVAATIVLFVALELHQARTRAGRAFRAVAQDRQAASLMGVDPKATVRLSFLLAGGLTGLAGVLIGGIQGVRFNIGLGLGVAGFVAAVVGGLGSTRGAIAGGYLVAAVEGLVGVLSAREEYKPIAVFAVFVIVLTLRPVGLVGRPVAEKV